MVADGVGAVKPNVGLIPPPNDPRPFEPLVLRSFSSNRVGRKSTRAAVEIPTTAESPLDTAP